MKQEKYLILMVILCNLHHPKTVQEVWSPVRYAYFLYDFEKRIAPNVHLIADDYHCKWKYAVQTALHQSAQP
jgi:hypothetical protein